MVRAVMSQVRNAIILAAGMARRLAPTSDLLPKGLVEIGGQPLLLRSVELLAASGIAETLIVTGYRAAQIEAALGPRRNGMAIRYLHNPDYAETGSMVSLLAAAPQAPGPVLLLESDLLYHPAFLDAALGAEDDVLLAADLSGSGDEVYLGVDGENRLCFLGKNPPENWRRQSVGELAGISRISRKLLTRFAAAAKRSLRAGRGNRHYEEILFEIAAAGWPIRVQHCPGLPWTEIDTPLDLRRAHDIVWPRLAPPAEDAAQAG